MSVGFSDRCIDKFHDIDADIDVLFCRKCGQTVRKADAIALTAEMRELREARFAALAAAREAKRERQRQYNREYAAKKRREETA